MGLLGVEIAFTHEGILRSVPQEVSLCVYRVLQEALQNAVKHSGVGRFNVKLHGTSGEIQLTVSDSGTGFDPHDSISPRGLGLVSMCERVRLVNGTITIQSKPKEGTIIHISVPTAPQPSDQRTSQFNGLLQTNSPEANAEIRRKISVSQKFRAQVF